MQGKDRRESSAQPLDREGADSTRPQGGGWRQWAWFAGLYLASLLALLVVVSLVKLLLPVSG